MFFSYINKGFIKEGDVRLKLRCESPLHFLPRRGMSPPRSKGKSLHKCQKRQADKTGDRHPELDSGSVAIQNTHSYNKPLLSFAPLCCLFRYPLCGLKRRPQRLLSTPLVMLNLIQHLFMLDYQNFFINELYSFIRDVTSFEE